MLNLNKGLNVKNEKIISNLLIIIFPYSIALLLLVIQNGNIMEKYFDNNIYIALFYILIIWILAFTNSIVLLVINIFNENNHKYITKTIMIIKLIQIPSYIINFILGFICIITLFTLPITLFLILFDCLAITLTGIIGISSVIKLKKMKIITIKEMILFGFLQFIFCIDVIISIILYIKSKKSLLNQ